MWWTRKEIAIHSTHTPKDYTEAASLTFIGARCKEIPVHLTRADHLRFLMLDTVEKSERYKKDVSKVGDEKKLYCHKNNYHNSLVLPYYFSHQIA